MLAQRIFHASGGEDYDGHLPSADIMVLPVQGVSGETEIQERIELQSYPRSAPDLTIRCASMVKDRTISFAFVADERPRAELYTGPRSHQDLGGLCVSRVAGGSCGLKSKKPAPWPEAGGVPGLSAVVVAIGMCRLRVQPPC